MHIRPHDCILVWFAVLFLFEVFSVYFLFVIYMSQKIAID